MKKNREVGSWGCGFMGDGGWLFWGTGGGGSCQVTGLSVK